MSYDLVMEDNDEVHSQPLNIVFLMESNFSIVLEPTNEIVCPSSHLGLYVSMTAHALWEIKKYRKAVLGLGPVGVVPAVES